VCLVQLTGWTRPQEWIGWAWHWSGIGFCRQAVDNITQQGAKSHTVMNPASGTESTLLAQQNHQYKISCKRRVWAFDCKDLSEAAGTA